MFHYSLLYKGLVLFDICLQGAKEPKQQRCDVYDLLGGPPRDPSWSLGHVKKRSGNHETKTVRSPVRSILAPSSDARSP